jgi:M6 family metalloprotease-like protein
MRLLRERGFFMKKTKITVLTLLASSMLIAGCTKPVTSSSSNGGSASASSQGDTNTPNFVFDSTALGNAKGILSDTTGYYTATGVTVTSVKTVQVLSTAAKNIKIGSRSGAGSITFNLNGAKAITSVKMNAAIQSGTKQTITFADSANPTGVTVDVTSTTFADYAFPSPTDTTGSVLNFTISVPAAAPLLLASLTFGLQDGVEVKASSFTLNAETIDKLPMGETRAITCTTDPAAITFPAFTYASSNDAVATVSSDGVIKGTGVGDATITVTLPGAHVVSGSDISHTIAVNVIDPNVFLQGFISTKDGSTYGGNAKPAATDGTNYKATATSITQHQLSAGSGILELPSVKKQNILVIPVSLVGYESRATEDVRTQIYKTMFGDPADTGWESLASFYWKSSFQQQLINGTVSEWWNCGYTPTQISKWTDSEWSNSFDPTWRLLEEAVAWYKARYRTTCKEFDNDDDGAIDGVWMVYDCPSYADVSSLPQMFWAYTFEDLRAEGPDTEAIGFKYAWASINFMYEGYGSKADAHTFIHETGHMMGLDDYYTYSGASNFGPMAGLDMMDYNIIDHNAYSKFAYGWITPYVVSGSTSITLKPASTTGEAILLPDENGWNGSAFDEYILMEFYTPTNLNEKDSTAPYGGNKKQGFTENGVRIYHVDARMVTSTWGGKSWGAWTYTDTIQYKIVPTSEDPNQKGSMYTQLAHSNSDSRQQLTDGIEKKFRLIQEMDCTQKRDFTYGKGGPFTADNGTLFQAGDSFSLSAYHDSFAQYYYIADGATIAQQKELMNDGSVFPYTVSFSDMSDASIKVTITKA